MDFLADFEADATENYFQPSPSQKTDIIRWQSSQACAALESLLVEAQTASNRTGDRRTSSLSRSSTLLLSEPPPTPIPTVPPISSKRSRHSVLNVSYRNENSITPEPSLDEKSITAAFTELAKQVNTQVDENLHLKSMALKTSGSKSISVAAKSARANGRVKKKSQTRGITPTGRILESPFAGQLDVKGKGKSNDVHMGWVIPQDVDSDSQQSFMDVDTSYSTEDSEIRSSSSSLPGPSGHSRLSGLFMPPPLPPDTSQLDLSSFDSMGSGDPVTTMISPPTRTFRKSLSANVSYASLPVPSSSPEAPNTATSTRMNAKPPSAPNSTASKPISATVYPHAIRDSTSPKTFSAVISHQTITIASDTVSATIVTPAPSLPHPNRPGPPPLGMRRTHTFPSSQSMMPPSQTPNGLPTKQRGFKAPLLARPPIVQPQDKNAIQGSGNGRTTAIPTHSSSGMVLEEAAIPSKTTGYIAKGPVNFARSSTTGDTSVTLNGQLRTSSRTGSRNPVGSVFVANPVKDHDASRYVAQTVKHITEAQYHQVLKGPVRDDDVTLLEDDPDDPSYGDISFDMDALEETMKMYD